MQSWGKTRGFLSRNTLSKILRWSCSQVSRFHSSDFSDKGALLHALESSKLSLDIQTATKAHTRILQCGYGTQLTLLASLISTYIHCHHLEPAHQLLNQISTQSQPSNLVILNLIIKTLTSDGECDVAEKVFRGMKARDVVSWNSMIGCLVKHGRFEAALVYFRDMLCSNTEPDGYTFSSVLSACAHLGVASHSLWIHRLMTERKIELNPILSGALINMYTKCGRIQTAREIFESSPKSDLSVWNTMINGLAAHGMACDAIKIFLDMEVQMILPDSITFAGILTACSHCGMVEEGRSYFNLMRNRYSIFPQLVHYGAMIDLLGRAGLLDEAHEMVKGMPMEPDVVIWRALLSACRFHKKLELGEVALANISNFNSGDLVLMSNTYCSLTRWEKAETMRDSMRRKGIHKSRGRSWIEVGGSVHHFKSGDRSQPEAKAIHRVLEELMKFAKSSGFVPSTELVLMDVSEEEKEGNLSLHSEKLAVAYGVLKTGPGTEITVFKNLRICYDCHEWMKLVSRMLRRVILVHITTLKQGDYRTCSPICEDLMAVDWTAEGFSGSVAPSPGSAVKVSLLKLKENLGENVRDRVIGVIRGQAEGSGAVEQLTCGVNFSPARAKGFSIGSLAVFKGVAEMEAADSNRELVESRKEKVRDFLDGVTVVNYLVPGSSTL